MTTTKKRTKRMKAPEIPAPGTLAEAEELLGRIGADQRRVDELETAMNDRIASIKAEFEAAAAPLNEKIEAGFAGLQVWAEAHRGSLLGSGKKSAAIATGELGWRRTPPSVRISGVQNVLEALKNLKLQRFIRTKEEIDKDAIKKDPKAAEGVKGISITQQEEFWIKPFESKIERARARKVS